MSSSDDAIQSANSMEQGSHSFNNRRDSASERRQNILHHKQTDHLPSLGADIPNAKVAWRQMMQLREENKRLRWEMAEYERDIAAVHSNHQQEMEQLEFQMQEMTEERNRTKEALVQLEYRYQELYHTFQSGIEEEAQRIVEEAARTLVLTPEHRHTQQNDLMKTVELHVRQVEDKNTAESLYLMRQAQRKAAQLEQELAKEREHIAIERQNIHNLQNSIREQALLRKRIVTERLQAQYALTVTLITTVVMLCLLLAQIAALTILHIKITPTILIALFAPLVLCIVLAAIFSYIRSSTRILVTNTPHAHKVPEKKEEKK